MKHVVGRVVRGIVGVALLPVCLAATRALADVTLSISPTSDHLIPPAGWALIGGFLLWQLVYTVLPRPVRTYVLAHELTHALWGSLMGARVSRMRVSRESGSVTLSKSNFLIVLAPYFFPLYTVLVITAYYVLSVFIDVGRYDLVWLGLVGFTWGFHATFTVTTLMQQQTDIRECGHLFSYTVIYLFNVLGIGIWVVMVSSATLEEMIGALGGQLVFLGDAVRDLAPRIVALFRQ